MGIFRRELDAIYERLREKDGGEELAVSIPEIDNVDPAKLSQLSAHQIPVWAEGLDVAGAFEALRLVGCEGMGKDDDDALLSFVDLIALNEDFSNGQGFWRNCYRLW